MSRGNFRPIGRFLEYFEQAAIFDVATATGLPPYVIQGAIRLVMIALLSYVATHFILTLYRSAELEIQDTTAPTAAADNTPDPPPLSKAYRHCTAPVEVFPFLFAACLIVVGPQHPISFFPFFLISAAITILAIPLYVASHTAFQRTRIKIREIVATVLLGAAVAMFYDLLFILPLICLVVLLLRGWIMGITVRKILRTNAFLRYLTFSCGFLTVFIPARIAIYTTCKGQAEDIIEGCQVHTELALSGSTFPLWIGRAFSGLPWKRPVMILRGDFDTGLSPRGLQGLLGNTWTIIVTALMLLLAARAGHRLIHKQAQLYASDTPRKDSASKKPKATERRVGTALIITGVTLVGSSSLLVSSTSHLQEWYELGWELAPFRDTLLVQTGWAFMLFGALHLLLLMSRRLIIIGIALALFSSILVSRLLSSVTQGLREQYELGWGIRPFRDTLLVRIGWALALLGALYLLFWMLRKFKVLRLPSGLTNGSKYLLIAGSAVVLFGLTMLTFIANDRYALARRYDPNSNIDNLIAVAAVDFDNTERGQHIRCQLIDAYTERWPEGTWVTGEFLLKELNRLTTAEYGSEFCPTSP